MPSLLGKSGIVTGAAQGIGAACAQKLVSEGAAVLLVDIKRAGIDELVVEITEAGGQAVALQVDLTQEDDVKRMIADCRRHFGGLDFLMQNAAAQVEKPLHETSNDDWELLHAVNLRALFWGAKHAIPHMLADGRGGNILNMASVLALSADPLLAAYTVMKHGVLGLTRSIATNRQYAAAGIRCNCICPGDILTPMQHQYWAALPDGEQAHAVVAAHYPGGKIGMPSNVADCAAFLLSDQSSFINGSAIVIDGGLTSLVY